MQRIRTNGRSGAGFSGVLVAGLFALLVGSSASLGAEPMGGAAAAELIEPRALMLSMALGATAGDLAEPAGSAGGSGSGESVRQRWCPPGAHDGEFGRAGQCWLSLSFGVAPSSQTDSLVQVGYHKFLADRFELGLFLGGWYHDQDENAAASASLSLHFRYHFINEDAWSMYGLVGAGLMGSSHNVPDGGTGFNFLPTIGLGGTVRLGDGPTRLDVGVRWHHISNANINSSGRNPDRDAAMIYVGVMFPF